MSKYTRFRSLDSRHVIYLTLMWSRALVPLIALFAALASAVRTFQTTADIYIAGGTNLWIAGGVSGLLTIAVEGAIFGLAMARQWQEIRWRQTRKKRHVTSLLSVWRSLKVRVGLVEPLSYDQLPDNNNIITLVVFIAFSYALISNFNMGVRPLLIRMGAESNLQSFIASLVNAKADIQIAFIVDSASILFPPFMALAAGHLTARYASEAIGSMNRTNASAERVKSTKVEQAEKSIERSSKGARERVIEHLTEHPEDLEGLSQQKLAKQLRVSAGTVNKVYQEMRSPDYSIERSSNGHRSQEQ